MTHDDALKQQCIKFLDEPPMSIPWQEEPECVQALMAFARAVEREKEKEIYLHISQRYASGAKGIEILTWVHGELDRAINACDAAARGRLDNENND